MKKRLLTIITSAAVLLSVLPAAAAVPEPEAANDHINAGVIGGADGPTEIYVSEPDSNIGNGNKNAINSYVPYDAIKNIPTAEIPFPAEIAEKYGIEGAANIYYNSQYLDPAIIIQSRTMLPFRDFFETIGADVAYDEKTKTVTAVRDETEISFALDSDTIHIKNNLGEKDTAMDVTPVVIEGNTYAPLRFLGEAFAMQVDWNNYERTALVADFEKYYDELWEKCPNIMKIAELGLLQPERAATNGKAGISFRSDFPELPSTDDNARSVVDISLSLEQNGTQLGINSNTASKINFNYSDPSGNSIEVKDASLELIMKDETIYFKTNIGEQLTDIPPEAAEYLQNQWFKLSLEDYFGLIAGASTFNVDMEDMRDLLNHSQDPRAMLEYQLKSTGSRLYWTSSVDMITNMVEIISKIDSYINVAETGEDDYLITMKMDKDDLIDCIVSLSYMSEDEADEIRDEFNNSSFVFNVDLEEAVTDRIVTSQKLAVELALTEYGCSMSFRINTDATVDPNAEVGDIEIPADAVDIIEKIYGI